MNYGWTVTIAPVAPNDRPVTVEMARAQCRVPDESQDSYLGLLIDSATAYVQTAGRLLLCPQTIRVELEGFPCGNGYLTIPLGPVRGNVLVEYYSAADDAWATYAERQQWTIGVKPVLAPAHNENWPAVKPLVVPGVRLTYTAGFADVASIPAALKNAVLMLVTHNYNAPDGMFRNGDLKVPMVIQQFISSESRRGYP